MLLTILLFSLYLCTRMSNPCGQETWCAEESLKENCLNDCDCNGARICSSIMDFGRFCKGLRISFPT